MFLAFSYEANRKEGRRARLGEDIKGAPRSLARSIILIAHSHTQKMFSFLTPMCYSVLRIQFMCVFCVYVCVYVCETENRRKRQNREVTDGENGGWRRKLYLLVKG